MIIIRTTPESPAARAGLRGVDAATGLLGDLCDRCREWQERAAAAHLTEILESLKLPGTVNLTVQRGSQRRTVTVEVIDIGN